jgi:hypothetical protein
VLALYAEQNDDFGPTLAYEKLAERDEMTFSVSTLRWELIAAGLWQPEWNGRSYRFRQAARDILGKWHNSMTAITIGLREGGAVVVLLP